MIIKYYNRNQNNNYNLPIPERSTLRTTIISGSFQYLSGTHSENNKK